MMKNLQIMVHLLPPFSKETCPGRQERNPPSNPYRMRHFPRNVYLAGNNRHEKRWETGNQIRRKTPARKTVRGGSWHPSDGPSSSAHGGSETPNIARKVAANNSQGPGIHIKEPARTNSSLSTHKMVVDEFISLVESISDRTRDSKSPSPICPSCLVFGRDPYHIFGSDGHLCSICCHGCGINHYRWEHLRDDYKCRSFLYQDKKMGQEHEEAFDRDCRWH